MSQIGIDSWKLLELEELTGTDVNPDWVDLEKDMVNKPQHYTYGGIECIDAMKAMMSKEEYIGYLRGAAFKYLWRYPYKGKPKEDLRKAMWYLDKLTKVL